MDPQRNYDTFMKELQVCVKKKDDETKQIDDLSAVDAKGLSKPGKGMDKDLENFRNNSNDMMKKIQEQQDFIGDMKNQQYKIFEPLPPENPTTVQTNYAKRYDPKLKRDRLTKIRSDADFDKKYQDYAKM